MHFSSSTDTAAQDGDQWLWVTEISTRVVGRLGLGLLRCINILTSARLNKYLVNNRGIVIKRIAVWTR